MRRPHLAGIALFAALGCGGASRYRATPTPNVGPVVSLAWAARLREVGGPSAATYATVTIYKGSIADAIPQLIQRPAGAVAVTTTTTLSQPVKAGVYLMNVSFYATSSLFDPPLAYATVNVRVKDDGTLVRADGTPLGTIQAASTVASVAVGGGQSVVAGTTVDLLVTATTQGNQITALAPGSTSFAVTAGAGSLRANADGTVTGLAEGTATVVPTVDGVSGAPTTVVVTSASLATRIVAASSNAFLYDSARARFLLAVPATDPNGNSVRSLDPVTGALGAPLFVGANPSTLAISDDGTTLYAGLRGANAVRRIDLTTNTAGLQFSLPLSGFLSDAYALDLSVQPGHPGTVAATTQDVADSGYDGPVVFDDGVARPNRLGTYQGKSLIWLDPSRILAFDYNTSPYGLDEASVDASGATLTRQLQGGLVGSSAGAVLAGGRLYDLNGLVADVTTLDNVGSFALAGGGNPYPSTIGPAIDLAANSAYFVQFENGAARLRTFRLDTFLETASRPLSDVTVDSGNYRPSDTHLFRWGAKGLAFSLGDRIVLIDDVSGL